MWHAHSLLRYGDDEFIAICAYFNEYVQWIGHARMYRTQCQRLLWIKPLGIEPFPMFKINQIQSIYLYTLRYIYKPYWIIKWQTLKSIVHSNGSKSRWTHAIAVQVRVFDHIFEETLKTLFNIGSMEYKKLSSTFMKHGSKNDVRTYENY